MNEPPSSHTPELSVIVPTFERPERVSALLERLDAQTLAPERFELLLVDDGSRRPIALDGRPRRFGLELLRQENAGPGAARNLALTRCRAPWTVILNDDALPANDLLEMHLAAARSAPPKTAILGSFRFTERALQSPFTQIVQATDLVFDFPRLVDRAFLGWPYFWTCNLGLPTAALREHGGFDAERFREAIVEDVELGYRMARAGWCVQYRAELVAEHDHVQAPAGYFRRMQRLGFNLGRMYAKHGDAGLLNLPPELGVGPEWLALLQQSVEAFDTAERKLITTLETLERTEHGQRLAPERIAMIGPLVRRISTVSTRRGFLEHFEGRDPGRTLAHGPREGVLTSIVVVSFDALETTRKCITALRAAHDPRHPTEIVVVDNGSSDGSAEWLVEQRDVELIRNPDNAGAPRARNQAFERVRGEWIVVMDNDALVTPGWLRRLLHHGEVDARSGCIGPVSDRAAHDQQIAFDGPTDPLALARFADARAAEYARQFRFQSMLTSFCLLVRRAVVDAIGGFDERFSPWGFEDDDFTLRAAVAGFRNRVALDVFVRHEHYGGAKSARHEALLRRNWSAFAEKWSGCADVPYGDYAALEPALKLALETQRPSAPLPAREPIGADLAN